ncbi:MAG TPA: 50S ribosomal protein L17 [Caldithrix abyssi]|uniref:Large ribosomal subunit protein bL17 n=1 Tax=Caldithrix abyssi TaxID=187145 RepID=A0A7V5UF49_CALAY|nr:50S ribosomal protein L17 [Caldithrix abyssi]
MRHRKKGNHLGRTASHKKALMRNLAAQVIEHKEVKTTLAKAKELRSYVERLITYGKKGTVHHRRLAFRFLQNKAAVTSLFEEIAPVYETRNGGYTRIIKLGRRKGDGAEISVFQLVGFEKGVEKKKEKKAKKEKAAEEKAPQEVAAPAEETKPETEEAAQEETKEAQTEQPEAEEVKAEAEQAESETEEPAEEEKKEKSESDKSKE